MKGAAASSVVVVLLGVLIVKEFKIEKGLF